MSTTCDLELQSSLGSLPSSENTNFSAAVERFVDCTDEVDVIRAVIEQLPGPVYAKDRDRRYIFVNDACLRLFGRTRTEVLGATDSQIFEVADAYNASDDRLFESGQPHSYETSVPLPDGGIRDVLVDKRLAEGGRLVVGQMADITSKNKREAEHHEARELAERAAEEARNTLDLLHEATVGSVQGIIVLGENNIEFCNDRARELNGVPESVLGVGKPWLDFFEYQMKRGDFGEGRAAQEFMDALLGNFEKREVMQIERNAGNGKIIRADRIPNSLGGLTLTLTDITDIKRRERELKEARNQAQSAERAKSEFLANMSHEIRTPMNGVMGMAELLMGGELSPKQKMFAEMIVKSGASLLTIINDILDFSKIDAGQLELSPAPFHLAEAVEDVATLVSTGAADKNLELIVRVDPTLPSTYMGDAGRIRQIITNLMGNAVKFTDTGHVYVNVSGEVAEGNRASLHFRIEDTGTGIPEQKCESVFDKFQQVDSSATREHEGTGLGLSIASSLVELMDGEIGVESKEGIGSTFWFTIELPVESEPKRKQKIPVDVTGSRVLIIDDNHVNRSILSEQMEAWKFEHAEMATGELGLTFIRQALRHGLEIDLVVLDYQMPNMSGGEVLREMRSDPATADIPVILLTSVDTADVRVAIGNFELQATLTKPTRSSVMLDTMVEVISEARGSGAAREFLTLSSLAQAVIGETHEKVDRPRQEPASCAASESAPQLLPEAMPPELRPSGRAQLTLSSSPSDDGLDILVAEDNEVNQMLFAQILETTEYRFKIVENGKLAVASWQVHQPKLVLMDVSMPTMNGHDATREIRRIEGEIAGGDRVTIVAVTAHALNGDKETCFDAGMDDYLPKPISVERLKQVLTKHLAPALKMSAQQSA